MEWRNLLHRKSATKTREKPPRVVISDGGSSMELSMHSIPNDAILPVLSLPVTGSISSPSSPVQQRPVKTYDPAKIYMPYKDGVFHETCLGPIEPNFCFACDLVTPQRNIVMARTGWTVQDDDKLCPIYRMISICDECHFQFLSDTSALICLTHAALQLYP